MTELAIETRDLVKRYGSVGAVDGLSLSVPRGAVYALVGRNGSGKTTTIRMLLDLSLPDAGTARVLGMDCHAERVKVLERVGYVSDRPLLGCVDRSAAYFVSSSSMVAPTERIRASTRSIASASSSNRAIAKNSMCIPISRWLLASVDR